jgi:hypothetical protein
MYNVLNVYSKQLRQNLASEDKSGVLAKPLEDRVNLTPEAKRQTTIEKVSRDILDKISSYGSLLNSHQRISAHAHKNANQAAPPVEVANQTFVFNAIDGVDNKIQNTLSVEDSSFLIQRLDQ